MKRALLSLLLCACSGAVVPSDAGLDAQVAPDAPSDAGTDAFRVRTHEVVPEPGPFVAGMAEVEIPAPLGIGTMGFGAITAERSVTPFAANFPGTTRSYGHLRLRAVALSR